MAGQSSAPRRTGGSGNVLGFMGAIVGALICFIGAAAEASALGRPHKLSTAVLAVIAIAFAVGSIVLVWLAIHLEHGFRTAATSARPAATVVAPTAVKHPKNGPVSRIILTVASVAVIAFVVWLSFSLHSDASRSSYTQHHGLVRTGTIASVHRVDHDTRYSSWESYDYDLTLAVPADGATRTVAHDPTKDFQQFEQGSPIKVLVDPKQLDYAELPGQRVQTSRWYAGPILLGVIFVGLAALLLTEEIKHRRLRRATDTSAAQTQP
jgi:hypothetical protein